MRYLIASLNRLISVIAYVGMSSYIRHSLNKTAPSSSFAQAIIHMSRRMNVAWGTGREEPRPVIAPDVRNRNSIDLTAYELLAPFCLVARQIHSRLIHCIA